jgi:ATP-dependent DNA helicase RecG
MLHVEHATIPIDVLEEMIALGGSYKTEFHESIPPTIDLVKTIGALANSKGGSIFLGISSKGETVDLGDKYAFLARIEEAIDLLTPRPTVQVQAIYFKNREIILIKVLEGDSKPYLMQGAEGPIAFVRSGEGNVQASRRELRHLWGR